MHLTSLARRSPHPVGLSKATWHQPLRHKRKLHRPIMKSTVNVRFNRTSFAGVSRWIILHFSRLIRPPFGLAVLFSVSIIHSHATAGSFSNAGPLITGRNGQTATLLSNGKML